MTSRVHSNLFLGDTSDAVRFGFPMTPLQGTLDLTGWDAEKEMEHGDFFTIKRAISMIDHYVSRDIPLLVFCHAGMDRSPFIVACYIHVNFDFLDEVDAYEFVKEKHPQTIIHDDWMRLYQSSLGKAINDE